MDPTPIPASAITARPSEKPGWAHIVVVTGPDAPIHESSVGCSFEIEVPRKTARQLARTLKAAAER